VTLSRALAKYETTNYEIYILEEEEKEYLKGYSLQAAATDGIMPNVYGVRHKGTKQTELYCYNLAAALSVQNSLEEGIVAEMEKRTPKRPDLRTV